MKGKKNEYEDLDLALGNSVEVDGLDKFKMNHIPLGQFSEFMKHITKIDYENLWTNFLGENNSSESINKVFEMSFKDSNIDELMEQINAENYPIIMKKILKINGIDIKGESEGSKEGKKKA